MKWFKHLSGSLNDSLIFEGTTANAFETRILAGDPTGDTNLTLPNLGNDSQTVGHYSDEIVTATNVLVAGECGTTYYL